MIPIYGLLGAVTVCDVKVGQLQRHAIHGTFCRENDRDLPLHILWQPGHDRGCLLSEKVLLLPGAGFLQRVHLNLTPQE